ncbi:ribosome biogenesis GTP-binding protein YihA/YsxC [Desulforamulus hydrothermalis]|uniref:Probable GTP-binding protein EngB n=1 Tax=Desulforamulus hydrothermalis Lam5 = DSM 18033 TaxID=1121428 RepID=K8EG59_9FIRM|nr:ribosome biogenesis GTP-binding protein YihA/YsxC [Desulforamulus hydrothermalis]CCO07666.1 putative GTP-binding protein EngB [Desulforamulus hydrothermalis Lam5 = DSM 18033]SHH24907.1 GTP-binding protein [Desulforamulus hydrothermalis Lam5 = DSM 18033]
MKIVAAEFLTSAVNPGGYPPGDLPEIAFVGRSNVGKSSLINRLVNRKGLARTSSTPGRTQLINFFKINDRFIMVDLPGYGYARVPEEVKARWGKMIEGYLKNRENLRGVCLLLDCRHTPTAQDIQMYRWLQYYRLPAAVVATKADKLSNNQWAKQQSVIKKTLSLAPEHSLIAFSAETGRGRDELLDVIKDWLQADQPRNTEQE